MKAIIHIEHVEILWYQCPTCGKELPVDPELAGASFNHAVVLNGNGVRVVCPEMVK